MFYVYRVEDDTGYGPYRGNVPPWETRSHRHLPLPDEEGLPIGSNILSGFISMKQLLSWFTKRELQNLAELGFRPRRVLARRVWKGKRQATFIRYGNHKR